MKFRDYEVNSATSVIFIETANSKIEFANSSNPDDTLIRLEAFVVAGGNTHIHSYGRRGYVVSVPQDAWKQYTAGTVVNPTSPDTSALNEYPGDNGLNVSSSPWTLPSNLDDAGITGVAMHAFFYSKSFNCTDGNNIIVGSFYVPTNVNTRSMTIYFDPNMNPIQYEGGGGNFEKKSWREVKRIW